MTGLGGPGGLALQEIEGLPSILVEGAALDLVELAVSGALDVTGFATREQLPTAVLPLALPVSVEQAERLAPVGRAVLEDAEGVPVAVIDVTDTWTDPDSTDGGSLVGGNLSPLRPLTHGAFRRLRLRPVEVAAELGHAPGTAVLTCEPLRAADNERVRAAAGGEAVLVLALVGSGRAAYPGAVGLVQALRAGLPELPKGSLVVPVPLPTLTHAAADESLRRALAAGYGAIDVIDLVPAGAAALDAAVASGVGFTGPVLDVLRAHRPAAEQRGIVLLFTGLSGSGKSTVAKGVADALLESTNRTLTLLDGDVVRRHLSKGLGFSRADRDTNIRRIGFVAAEVARHGGIAICAPIAPYASTRTAVREMVEEAGGVLVLVHVSTPLDVCEARDRKGLYALARAGKIPEFTGISDPYEEPADADLRIDTSVQAVGEAVDVVLEELRTRGFVPTARREDD